MVLFAMGDDLAGLLVAGGGESAMVLLAAGGESSLDRQGLTYVLSRFCPSRIDTIHSLLARTSWLAYCCKIAFGPSGDED